jgi:hypothetical protein
MAKHLQKGLPMKVNSQKPLSAGLLDPTVKIKKLPPPSEGHPLRRQEAYSSPKINRARVARPEDMPVGSRPEDRLNWSHTMNDRLVKPKGLPPIKPVPAESFEIAGKSDSCDRIDVKA